VPCARGRAYSSGFVENANVNEYVRSSAIDTFLVLCASDQMSREDVVAYYRSLFHGKLERRFSSPWNWLVYAVAELRAHELLEDVRQAYTDDLVDPFFAKLEEIERDLASPAQPLRGYHIITDAVSEMERWACFGREKSKPVQPISPPPALGTAASQASVRRAKVGRNEPCPCGSGKKYKKCCSK